MIGIFNILTDCHTNELNLDAEEQTDYKLELEKDLENYYEEKIKEKKKEWEDQVERAKWKVPVQAHGEMRCKNGHKFNDDPVMCGKCLKPLFWVDSDERYAICKGCNRVRQLSGTLYCSGCNAEALCTVKWIEGYKP